MDRNQEVIEAKIASENLLRKINEAEVLLRKAKVWGIWDILGGGLLVSFIKRSRINQANQTLREVSDAMKIFLKELNDVDDDFDLDLNASSMEYLFDTWFDNIFTDMFVQSKLNNQLRDLNSLREKVQAIDDLLDEEISQAQ